MKKMLLELKTMSIEKIGTLFLVLTISLLSGCGDTAEFQPLRFNPPVWQSGEHSIYRLTNVENDFAGTMEIELRAADQKNEGGWILYREINSSPKEVITVEVNKFLRPQTSLLERIDTTGREMVRTIYAGSQTDIELTNKRDMISYERVSLPSDAYDLRTVLPFARSLPLADGYATQLNAFLPITGKLERVALSVVDQEMVTVPAGSFKTWKLELTSQIAETEAWISIDAPFELVKFIDSRNRATFELQEFVEK